MQALLGFIALALNLIGYIPYIRDIFRKKVKPHRVTWGVWTILTTIATVNQVINGGGYSLFFFISTTLLVVTVFFLSFRFGLGGASKIDRLCLILTTILLIYWIIVRETHISSVLVVIIDAFGVIPTLIKTYHHSKTETYIQWSLASIAGFLTILAVPRFDWILIIYPFYVFIMDGAIVGIKYFRER